MTDELITDCARIGAILGEMRQCVRVLNVRLDPKDPLYSSSIIRLDPEQCTLFLDELNPQVGHWSLDPGQAIVVPTSLRGVAVRFTTGIAEILSEDGIALHVCPYPEALPYLQYRKAFRIHLPLGEGPGIGLLLTSSGAALIGRIIDLSAPGCCVELPPRGHRLARNRNTFHRFLQGTPKPRSSACLGGRTHQYPSGHHPSGHRTRAFYNRVSGHQARSGHRALAAGYCPALPARGAPLRRGGLRMRRRP